jgi:hypothetical protein
VEEDMSEDKKAMENFKERLTGDVSEMVNTNLGKPRKFQKKNKNKMMSLLKNCFEEGRC